jgi:hypothetical protein
VDVTVGKLLKSSAGAVYVEFLVAFVPVFFFFLAMVQLSFVYSAKLVVQHAAVAGVRSAIVVLEDDIKLYDGEPYGSPTGLRLGSIRWAAYVPLLAIAPSETNVAQWFQQGVMVGLASSSMVKNVDDTLSLMQKYFFPSDHTNLSETLTRIASSSGSVADAIGGTPVARLATGLVYNQAAAAVTFPKEPGSNEFVDKPIKLDEKQVTVRVTYLFPCTIPLASVVVCKSLSSYADYFRGLKGARQGGGANIDNSNKKNIDPDYRQVLTELEHAEQPQLLEMVAKIGVRFSMLRAEATLPNQGARYYERDTEDEQGTEDDVP